MIAEDVKALLRARFGGDGAICMEEVGSGTGAGAGRWADMVAMETWPSRGLVIHGIEVKVSKYDWLREKANPEKAEAVHRYCDFWWLAVTPGVVGDVMAEVPAGWGVLEAHDDLTGKRELKVLRAAERQERGKDVPRIFVAAMLRAITRAEDARVNNFVRDEVHRRVHAERERDRERAKNGHSRFSALAAAVTAEMGGAADWVGDDEMARAMALVIKLGLTKGYGGLGDVLRAIATAEEAAKKIRARMEKDPALAAALDVASLKKIAKRDAALT